MWEYSLYCNICKNNSRSIIIGGADANITYVKSNNSISIQFIFRLLEENIDNNYLTFSNQLKVPIELSLLANEILNLEEIDKIKKCYPEYFIDTTFPYFFINADCKKCDSYTSSMDMDINFEITKILSISLERETFTIKDKYIILDHDLDKMRIYGPTDKEMILPLFDIDFSDLEKLEDKINTLITFS